MRDIIGDEMLMAYADGELDARERREIDMALARDAELRGRLGVFERTGAMLAKAFDAPLHAAAGLPPALDSAARRSGWVGRLKAVLAPAPGYGLAGAIAAVILIVATVAMFQGSIVAPDGMQMVMPQGGRIMAGGALQSALERQKSAGLSQADAPLAVVQTLRARDGRYCREYALAAGGSRGVACREADGHWVITLHLSDDAGGATAAFAPASAQHQVIDGYIHRIMEGDPLTGDAEAAVIGGDWRR